MRLLDLLWQGMLQRFESMPDREEAHNWTVRQLKFLQEKRLLSLMKLLCWGPENNQPLQVGGAHLANPFILPAGFDKHCEVLAACDAMGVGAVVGGTIVPQPQDGNPQRPRVFWYPEIQAADNCYGFNSVGKDRAAKNAAACNPKEIRASIGYSGGPNKDTPKKAKYVAEDCLAVMKAVKPVFRRYRDFNEINISSPNTKGLLGLFEEIEELLVRIGEGAQRIFGYMPALWLKIPPDDMSDKALARIVAAARVYGFRAIVAGNTSSDQTLKASFGIKEPGGVSGWPLLSKANDVLGRLAHTELGDLDLIAIGGITRPSHATTKRHIGGPRVKAFGAYTGLVPRGPSLIRRSLRAWEEAA